MLFLRKTDETIWQPPLSKMTPPPPPFQLTPLFLSKFFMTPSLSKFQKQEPPHPPHPVILGGEETMAMYMYTIPLTKL